MPDWSKDNTKQTTHLRLLNYINLSLMYCFYWGFPLLHRVMWIVTFSLVAQLFDTRESKTIT